jgi:hypothetical protein
MLNFSLIKKNRYMLIFSAILFIGNDLMAQSSCGDGNWPPGVTSCKQCCQDEYPDNSDGRFFCEQGCS